MLQLLYLGPPDLLEHVRRCSPGAEATLALDDAQVDSALPLCDAVLDAFMKVRFTGERLERAGRLKLFVTATTGADHVDAAALARRGIPLLTLRGQADLLRGLTPAAEHSWLLLMACARRLRGAAADVLAGQWDRNRFPGVMLKGRTLGIVGCGRIGQWMARYAAAFGMRRLGYDPHLDPWPEGIERSDLPRLLRESDFIGVHVPLSDDTRGLLGAAEFALVKPGAILVNTSRGEILDERALLQALEDGRLAAAGLDVLQGEPDVAKHPLVEYARRNPNLLITPHIGGYSPDALREVLSFSCRRIEEFFLGAEGAMSAMSSLADELVRCGLQIAFGVSGSGPSLDLISALESKGAAYYPATHEAAATLMAGAVVRATGRLSASIGVKGPGLANMIPGIAGNALEGFPALSLSEAFGADAPPWRRHKRLPHDRMLSGLVKASLGLEDLGNLERFLSWARAEVPGPIHLDLCRKGAPAALPPDPPAPLPPGDLLDRIERASRPAAVAGSLALRRPWGPRLSRLRVPVFTTVAAKGAVDERGPFAAGVLTGDGKENAPETAILAEADLVVGLGLRNTEVLTPRRWAGRTAIVDEAAGLADGFQADVVCAPAAPSAFDGILDALGRKAWGEAEVRVTRERLRGSLLDGSWLPAAGFEVLNTLPYPYGLVLDTGFFCTVGEHLWAAGKDREFLASANGRWMGASLPLALGLSVARPGLPVVCVAGDGGLRMYLAELRLAEAERLPVCLVLMSDGRYGSVAEPARDRAFSRRAVEIARPSWRAAVEGMGCPAAEVGSAEAFRKTLEAWDRSGPLYVEARFDPEAYGAMTRGLR